MHDLEPASRAMRRLVERVRDDQLAAPTPCPEYTLGDLMQHVVELAEAFTLAGRKEQPPGGSTSPAPGDASRLPADWRQQATSWLRQLAETWADPASWEGSTWIAGFEAPASAVGAIAVNELVVHGWDVARASGQPYVLDEASVPPCREFVASMSGPGSEATRGDAFGPPVPVPDDSSTLDEIIAGNGRDPAWTGPPPER